MCVLDGEGSIAFAGRALVVVQTTMYLTSYTDYYLTGFHEPLLLPC